MSYDICCDMPTPALPTFNERFQNHSDQQTIGHLHLSFLWGLRRIQLERYERRIQFRVDSLKDVPRSKIPESQDICALCPGSLSADDEDSKCESEVAKMLPCGHIMGFECLLKLAEPSGAVRCLYCQVLHAKVEVDYETYLMEKIKKDSLSTLVEDCHPPRKRSVFEVLGISLVGLLLPLFLTMILFTGAGCSLLLDSDVLPRGGRKADYLRIVNNQIRVLSFWEKLKVAAFMFVGHWPLMAFESFMNYRGRMEGLPEHLEEWAEYPFPLVFYLPLPHSPRFVRWLEMN